MQETSHFEAGSGTAPQPNTDAQSPSERVRTACAYGNYEQLTAAAEEDPELLSTPDELGYYPLQWAALNNRVGIIAYLIDKGVNVNRWVSHLTKRPAARIEASHEAGQRLSMPCCNHGRGP